MSNLPLGADDDTFAPYNIKEETFKVDVSFKGIAWYEYCDTLDLDTATQAVTDRITMALSHMGDVDIDTIDVQVS